MQFHRSHLCALFFAVMIPCGADAQSTPTLTTLHFFTGYPDDGANPSGPVTIRDDGLVLGTTALGGRHGPNYDGLGTVFFLSPPVTEDGQWTENIYSLTESIGGRPQGGVALGPNGVIYCVAGAQRGAVFQVTPPAMVSGKWTAGAIAADIPVILYPYAGVAVGPGGVLYSTSHDGASTFDGEGDVFSVTPPTSPGGSWTNQSIYNFGAPGASPTAGVVVGDGGVLYGTVDGGVYSLTPPEAPGGTWTETTLYTFGSAPGPSNPNNATVIIGPDGVLYGTTENGGKGTACSSGCGTVYSLTPPSSPGGEWSEKTLYSFQGGSDGSAPNGGVVIGADGALFGTTTAGGLGAACSGGCGTVFALVRPSGPGGEWTERVLHSFDSSDGAKPNAGVTIGRDGGIYGTTSSGGMNDCGTVFKME
jgi:uncharacterized repeat protein (TIGR03803 family)